MVIFFSSSSDGINFFNFNQSSMIVQGTSLMNVLGSFNLYQQRILNWCSKDNVVIQRIKDASQLINIARVKHGFVYMDVVYI